ncbi:hypothetical protein ACMD2_19218 [Ananas comosus]|uniref:Uncharacterized protein n=1 Tax=Ananas comosus TaxID=4615 RepID=A0A199W3V3_ANACO|nr:hypothetical protein ACMD2_19218 [Ananas comosus]
MDQDVTLGNEDTITICIQPLSILNNRAADVHRNMLLAEALLVGLQGVRPECSNANVAAVDLVDVSNAAVHEDPGPPHVLSQLPQVAADEGAPHAPAAVDHQHSPVPG